VWWALDAEVAMEGGRIVRTKNPTGHAVLVDCRFELPCGKFFCFLAVVSSSNPPPPPPPKLLVPIVWNSLPTFLYIQYNCMWLRCLAFHNTLLLVAVLWCTCAHKCLHLLCGVKQFPFCTLKVMSCVVCNLSTYLCT
jgi:hypothetical protein